MELIQTFRFNPVQGQDLFKYLIRMEFRKKNITFMDAVRMHKDCHLDRECIQKQKAWIISLVQIKGKHEQRIDNIRCQIVDMFSAFCFWSILDPQLKEKF